MMKIGLLVVLAAPLWCVRTGFAQEHPAKQAAGTTQRTVGDAHATAAARESRSARDARMKWWREARFGMFIHWGLYAIPAGEWNGQTNHAEWIRHTAHIPVEEYEKLVERFNPVKFDADAWARMAADAGMKYIVITTKHHDGFCLFDSKYTDFDIMSTPFKRDVMKELSQACRRHGLRICWYHSIMDWHHPDYLPRRTWEKKNRPPDGADFDRYVTYLRNQVTELLTHYGPIGVMWFDGEWESTWNHRYGQTLYDLCRTLQPDVIVNNRVDKGRGGMGGMSDHGYAGDFGTPEQRIPPTGLPGVDWETCMTMNRHWGYNKHDHDFKSTKDLIRKLADIASKGGNFLLNVGPKADGTFPQESIDRLRGIGRWMRVNGASIYATQASPFPNLPWGRCTQKQLPGGDTRLYLHVFDWPADARLVVPGIYNNPRGATLLADADRKPLAVTRREDALVIAVPPAPPDPIDAVVVLDVAGRADVSAPPKIAAAHGIFVDMLDVKITSDRENVEVRYTIDGRDVAPDSPRVHGPVRLTDSATVRARLFRGGKPVSPVAEATFRKVPLRPATAVARTAPGVCYEYYEGNWNRLPDFDRIKPVSAGVTAAFTFAPRHRAEHFAFRYRGFVRVPSDGVYTFETISDDGSRLYIGDELVVDNDGLHGMKSASGVVALAAGRHPITVTFFEKTGGDGLKVLVAGPGLARRPVAHDMLCYDVPSAPRPAPGAKLPAPSPRQVAWQEMELIAFVHFGINTFTDREWGTGDEDLALFNPTRLDARQWVRVLKAAGFKQVILTAKHHDGFCLWPSKYTEHSVKNSPWRGGQGDVVRELAEACREAGIKLGLYLSPWDRHEQSYGDSPRYNEYFKGQLAELLGNYGPVYEQWFDGACGEGPNGKRQVYDWQGYYEIVRRLAPAAVIFSDGGPDVRWVGNERGVAGLTNWSTLRCGEFYPGTPKYRQLTEGHEDGDCWVPAECDVSIRPGWFYHASQDDKVKSVAELVDIYYKSVGRNGVLLLNVPPDKRGLIHENDAARLAEFRRVLDETFATNLAAGADVTASLHDAPPAASSGRARAGVSGNTGRTNAPANVVDGDRHTWWMPDTETYTAALILDLHEPRTFDRAMLGEAIELGQRVRSFAIEAQVGGVWRQIAEGTTIGYKRLLRFKPVTAHRVRFVIRDARARPALAEVGLFRASPGETGE